MTDNRVTLWKHEDKPSVEDRLETLEHLMRSILNELKNRPYTPSPPPTPWPEPYPYPPNTPWITYTVDTNDNYDTLTFNDMTRVANA